MMRFTIRELVLVTVIVAMGAAWWIDRRAQFSDANSRAEKHQAEVARLQLEIANLNNLIDQIRLMNAWWKSPQRSAAQDGSASGIVPPPGAKLRDGFTLDQF